MVVKARMIRVSILDDCLYAKLMKTSVRSVENAVDSSDDGDSDEESEEE